MKDVSGVEAESLNSSSSVFNVSTAALTRSSIGCNSNDTFYNEEDIISDIQSPRQPFTGFGNMVDISNINLRTDLA